jgi:peptide/nickel transport system ATP-binding protein
MARQTAISTLEKVGIPDPEGRFEAYPHQLSGGMSQRVLIAMALACDPKLLIADEPTTALDVTIQAQILDLLDELQEDLNVAIQLITHDMAVISEMCDRVAVMYAGKKVEEGRVADVFGSPRHPYTLGLLKARPAVDDPRDRIDTIPGSMPDLVDTPSGCSFRTRCPYATEECAGSVPPLIEAGDSAEHHLSACVRIDDIDFDDDFAHEARDGDAGGRPDKAGSIDAEPEPLLEARGVRKYFDPESQSWLDRLLGERKYVHAVDDVSMTIHRGETFGLVGESGCGKTTLGRTLTQLYEPDEGTVLYAGEDLTEQGRREMREKRSDLQVIFQDPFSSLNPRRTVKEIIGRPLEIHGHVSSEAETRDRVVELLNDVGLDEGYLNRYPHEFSGGQKQRIGIARALAVEPDFIVADEPVSALDVSVQAKIINLLMDLQAEYGLTYLLIAHDLNVVQHISDRIGVMYLGELVEVGTVEQVFSPPHHPYTEMLLSSIPRIDDRDRDERIRPQGEPPSPIDPPSGCRFHTRCPHAVDACSAVDPETVAVGDDHVIDCHLYDESVVPADENPYADHIRDEVDPSADVSSHD